jgi:hypothetical protein
LVAKADATEQQLGPEYDKVIEGLELIDLSRDRTVGSLISLIGAACAYFSKRLRSLRYWITDRYRALGRCFAASEATHWD